MAKRENFVDGLECALDSLRWSPEQLAHHLDGKYSVEFLRSVSEGRPIGDVEEDVVRVLVQGLAAKIACSILESGLPDSDRVGQAARKAFVRIANRNDLRLREITHLAEQACFRVESAGSFRTQTLEIFAVDFWDSLLGNIAIELSQGKLFESDQSDGRDTEGLPLLVDNSTHIGQSAGK